MMRTISVVLLLGLVGASSASASTLETDSAANPIRKIVTLLQDMSKEIEGEGEKEKELFDKFMCYCETTTADLQKTADGASAQVSELSAKLEEDAAEKSTVEQELKEHKNDC